jgi:predicted transposase YdaD
LKTDSLVYKLPRLTREEIQQMLGFTDIDIKQTRFYQDVYAEGEQEGKLELILRLLNRRFGELDTNLIKQIRGLDVSQLEELAEALLEFSSQDDLEVWLQQSNI